MEIIMPQMGFGGGMGGTWFGNLSRKDQTTILAQLHELPVEGELHKYPALSRGERLFCVRETDRKGHVAMYVCLTPEDIEDVYEDARQTLQWGETTKITWYRGNRGDVNGCLDGGLKDLEVRLPDWLSEIKVSQLVEAGFDFKNPPTDLEACQMGPEGFYIHRPLYSSSIFFKRTLDGREQEVWKTLVKSVSEIPALRDKEIECKFLIMRPERSIGTFCVLVDTTLINVYVTNLPYFKIHSS